MSTEQALAKGTRVEITDPEHRLYPLQGEIVGSNLFGGYNVSVGVYDEHNLDRDQFRVIEQPEPTVGQLVDAMYQEIERVCKTQNCRLKWLDLHIRPDESGVKSSVGLRLSNWTAVEDGPTPQAALRAMIERLREIGGEK